MNSKLFVAAGAFAFAVGLSSAASAGISGITTDTGATLRINNANVALGDPVPSPKYMTARIGGAGYSTKAITTAEGIFFQAGTMSAGARNKATSVVEVSFDVENDTSEVLTEMISTVFESNFGMYVGNFDTYPAPPGSGPFKPACVGADLPNCTPISEGPGFEGLSTVVDNEPPFTLGYTSFLFEVLQDGVVRRTIGGTLQLDASNVEGEPRISFITGGGFGDLSSDLNGFEAFTSAPDRVWAFSWNDTDVSVNLDPIGIGETSTLTYRITSESWTDSGLKGSSLNSLVAFACLADPIGRGGTSGSVFTVPGFGPSTCNDFRGGTASAPTPYSFKLPTIRDGKIILTAPGAIPEPDTWAMLILGFGLVGLSMRRGKKAIPSTTA